MPRHTREFPSSLSQRQVDAIVRSFFERREWLPAEHSGVTVWYCTPPMSTPHFVLVQLLNGVVSVQAWMGGVLPSTEQDPTAWTAPPLARKDLLRNVDDLVAELSGGPGSVAATPAAVQAPPPVDAPQPAGWHADPRGRHELRYWDGSAWTEHVSDGGVQATDPV